MSEKQTDVQFPAKSEVFAPRSDQDIDQAFETLAHAPAHELDTAEKEAVLQLYAGLVDGSLVQAALGQVENKGGQTRELPPLREVADFADSGLKSRRPTFVLEYLQTDEGRQKAAEAGLDLAGADSIEELTTRLQGFDFSTVESLAGVEKLATSSAKFGEDMLIEAVMNEDDVEPPTRLRIITDPQAILENYDVLRRYRLGLRKISLELRNGQNDDLNAAKQMAVRHIRARVTELAAEFSADLATLSTQLGATFDTDQGRAHDLEQALDRTSTGRYYRDGDMTRAARRFDIVRNGINRVESTHEESAYGYSAVNPAMLEGEHELTPHEFTERSLSNEEAETLRNTEMNADQLKQMLDFLLEQHGLLSEVPADDTIGDRVGKAADGKWQVYIDPTAKNLAVDRGRAIMRIPTSFSRPVFQVSPAGAATGAIHEFRHVLQNEILDKADESGGGVPAIVDVKGARSSSFREGDAVREEALALARMFGANRLPSTRYAHGFRAFEQSGGDEIAAARAVYEDFLRVDPESDKKKRARAAIQIAQRFTSVGGYNSQPLVYPEQMSISNHMSQMSIEDARRFGLLGGAMSLHDAAETYQYGLLRSFQEADVEIKDTIDLTSQWLRDNILNDAKQTTAAAE